MSDVRLSPSNVDFAVSCAHFGFGSYTKLYPSYLLKLDLLDSH